jgi:hypothetical protein
MTPEVLIGRITEHLINPIIYVIFALAMLLFVWGLVEFLWGLRTGEAPDKGKQHMLWGTVGMFIMASIWGIIALIDSTLGLNALSGGTFDASAFQNLKLPGSGF